MVLNFTETNCFVRCCKEGERVLLKVEVRTMTESLFNDVQHSLLFHILYTVDSKHEYQHNTGRNTELMHENYQANQDHLISEVPVHIRDLSLQSWSELLAHNAQLLSKECCNYKYFGIFMFISFVCSGIRQQSRE